MHLIWDLDGTLIDSQADILYYLELAIHNSGLGEFDRIKPFRIGPPVDIMLEEVFPFGLITKNKADEIISNFRSYYDNSSFMMTKPFCGIDTIISDTDNFIHHIVTNKPDFAVKRIIKKMGWEEKITSTTTPYSYENVGTGVVNNRRTSKQDIFSDIIVKHGSDTACFIGIGDMRTDCLAAMSVHIPAVGVLWGAGKREELLDCCDYLFDDTSQLHDFLYGELS